MGDNRGTRIVVGVDASADSVAAAEWGRVEAEHRGLPLHLVHAAPAPLLSRDYGAGSAGARDQTEEARNLLERLLADVRARADGLAVSGSVVKALPFDAVLREADGAVLVVLGARGTGEIPQVPVGPVPVHVAALAPCPVVIVRAASGGAWSGPVVVGVDADPAHAGRPLMLAFEEAALRRSALTVVHALYDPALTAYQLDAGEYLDEVEHPRRRVLEERLGPWRSAFPDVDVRVRLVRKHPVSALLHESAGASLLVVGSFGAGVARGILMGSTSQALMRTATCPLAVVPPAPPSDRRPHSPA
jgi:nucleotide-binding universal stress UspA family protein